VEELGRSKVVGFVGLPSVVLWVASLVKGIA